jgi:hypothetical protein
LKGTRKAIMTTDLTPQYDSRASFYGKARIESDPQSGDTNLISYTTKVARVYANMAANCAPSVRHLQQHHLAPHQRIFEAERL